MTEEAVHQRLRTVRIIAAALMASVAVYVAIPFLVVGTEYTPPLVPFPPVLAWVLTVVAAGLILAGRLVEGSMLQRADASLPADATEDRLQAFQTATVVGFALRESAAVIGLLLTLLSGQLLWVVAMAAAALLAMVGAWPSRRRLQELVARTGPPPIDPSR